MESFVCQECRNKNHTKCIGGTYCDCQHREGKTIDENKSPK